MFLWILVFFSCVKEREWYVNTHVFNATLEANAYLQTNSDSMIEKVPLRYVIIQLFQSDYDRKMNQNSVATNQTDENGFAPLK